MTAHLTKLHRFLVNYYSLDELQILCFELGIEYENLGGRTRKTKARDLILHLGQAHRFDELLNQLNNSRPRAYEQEQFENNPEALQIYYTELDTYEHETRPFSEKLLQRVGLEQRVGFALVAVIIIAGGIFLYFALRQTGPERMTGDFNIAVAPFQVIGADKQRGEDVANSIFGRLQANFEALGSPIIHVWGPEEPQQNPIPPITGNTEEERADSAQKLAQEINADMVVYGIVDASSGNWQVTPEFFISAQNFQEASEILGQHNIGKPIQVLGNDPGALRLNAADELRPRSEGLAQLAVGLTYYSVTNYDRALQEFRQLEESGLFTADTGADVLYMMMGNTLGKKASLIFQDEVPSAPEELATANSLLNEAIINYDKALAINPDSARPYSGKGSAAYLLALGDGRQIDKNQLLTAITYLLDGIAAPIKPPYSEVESKLHLNLGQAYLLLSLIDDSVQTEPAVEQFQFVIDAYDNSQDNNDILTELAAEAHARLGLVYACSDNQDEVAQAVTHYQEAANLFVNRPERQKQFQENVNKLQETGTLDYCQ